MPRGQVVGVISGDTLAVKLLDNQKNSLAALCLEFVQAPRLGTYDGRVADEEGAWASWDFTRKLTLGQRILVDLAKGPSDLTRSHPNFGQLPVIFGRAVLFDKGKQDIGTAIIEAGMAKIRAKEKVEDDYIHTLSAVEEAAKNAKIGIWAPHAIVRKLPVDYNPAQLLKKKEFDGIVEVILNGSTFNVWLMPEMQLVTVQLAGVRCPSAKRGSPDPFGMEAKQFSESRLLQRNVKVTLYAENENGSFVGRIVHPCGDIAVFLLGEGLGEMNNQSAAYLPNSEDLRSAEKRAKEGKKNKWRNFDINILRTSRVDGRVISVKSANSIEVDDGEAIRRLWLSGCKTPQFNPSGNSEPFGLEAREKLRQMLIGRNVQCIIDYKVEDRPYATIYAGNTCVNEALAGFGYAAIMVSKNNNPSDRIDAMMRAEAEAKKKKLGIHSGASSNVQMNDLSNKHTRQKSVPFLHYIENKRNKGVIEHFVSATRVVVMIPDQHCILRMNLQGLVASDPNERLGHEALTYCQTNFLQRDVEVHIAGVDKVGCFIGNINLVEGSGVKSMEADLLAKGFTSIHEQSVIKCPHRKEMELAEKEAERNKIGVWSTRVRGVKLLQPGKVYEVSVVDLIDPVTVAIQIQSDELKKINAGLMKARQTVGKVMKGDLVAAIYDGKVYRAKVLKVDEKEIDVEFLELCIHDFVSISDLRVLPNELISIPPQAINVRIGGLKAFKFDEEFDGQAMDYVWSLCENAKLYAHLMYDEDIPSILLTDGQSVHSGSVNTMLLSKGMVRTYLTALDPPFAEILEQFCEIEDQAKAGRVGAWIHGNIGDDDDEYEDEY